MFPLHASTTPPYKGGGLQDNQTQLLPMPNPEAPHLSIRTLCAFFLDTPRTFKKTAGEYVDLVQSAGFKIDENDMKTSRPWWSRKDFGVTEKIGFPQKRQEVTEILMIARKPS